MPSTCVAGTNIYYVDNVGGSDSNTQAQAKSKSTPWAHAPYMASWPGTVTYSHTAGDCFVFKGGDTWVNADAINDTAGGSSSAQDYFGVDKTWYSGSSFARPIFDAQSALTPATKMNQAADYVTFDNWEFIHLSCSSSSGPIAAFNSNAHHVPIITNNYFHNFTAPSGGCGSDANFIATYYSYSTPPCDGLYDHNVVDGSDNSDNGYYAVNATLPNTCDTFTHNVIHDVCSAISTYSQLVAYNLIYNISAWNSGVFNCYTSGGFHPDAIQTATDSDVHDNVIYNMFCGEVVQVSPGVPQSYRGVGMGVSHPVDNIYNNVLYSNCPVPIELGTGGDPASTSGTANIYNNTLECNGNATVGSNAGGQCLSLYLNFSTLTIANNHLICYQVVSGSCESSSGTNSYCVDVSPFTCGTHTVTTLNYTQSSEVYQTVSTANGEGYTSSETYAYSPISSTNSTVTVSATNLTSSCSSTVLLCSDTQYGSAQSSSNQSVAGRTQNSRPSTGSWQAGAYTFGSSSSGQPAPPTGLLATVQ